MKSRLFASLALLCSLLLVWTLLAWARSYLPGDLHTGTADGRLILLFSQPGTTNYWKFRHGRDREIPVRAEDMLRTVRAGQSISPETYVAGTGADGKPFSRRVNVPPQVTSVAGVQFITEPMQRPALHYRMIVVPLLYVAALLAIPPGVWLALTLRRRRRLRAGLCRNCGYDLRESPGRCPECGEAAPAPAAAVGAN